MNDTELRSIVLRLLGEVVPELDPATIRPDVDLRDQLDIDSMDFLHFLLSVDKELHVDVPEADYGKLTTLNRCVAYLQAHMPAEVRGAAAGGNGAAPVAEAPKPASAGSQPAATYPAMRQHLARLRRELGRELPGPMGAFDTLYTQAMTDGVLNRKTKELMALAIAIAIHCEGCIAFHVHDALRAGAGRKEIEEAAGVAVMMGGGPASICAAQAFEALAQFETITPSSEQAVAR